MICLDSCKLKIDKSYINKINESRYKEITEREPESEIIHRALKCKNTNIVGFKSANIYDNDLIIEISGKVLKENYKHLININTIENVFDNINESEIINIDKNAIYDCKVLKLDVTNDLTIDNVKSAIKDLQLYYCNTKFGIDKYDFSGVVFRSKKKTNKERLIFYDKQQDILRDKRIFKYVKLQDFRNKLRVEQNITNFAMIRKKFNLKNNDVSTNGFKYVKLYDILESNKKINYDLFSKIFDNGYKQLELNLYELKNYDLKLYEIEKIKGRESIIIKLNYDIDLIREFLQSKVKGNITRYLREYKEIIYNIKRNENKNDYDVSESETIEKIKEMLKVA